MLVLASQSPRRRELLASAGIAFTVRVAPVDESASPGEAPEAYVRRLAEWKAMAVALEPGEVILAADTTVVVDEQILAKPEDDADAARMLRLLSGRGHQVLTGICLRSASARVTDCASTTVWFRAMSDAEIDAYVASGEPHDKAGAYAIQGIASRYVERIDGEYANVVGLPVAMVYRHLLELGAL